MTSHHLPAFVIITPLFAAYIILLLGPKYYRFARAASVVASTLLTIFSLILLYETAAGDTVVYHFGGWAPPWGIELYIDRITGYFLSLVAFITLLVVVFAAGTLEKEIRTEVVGQYYALLLILTASLLGIAASNDIFNIFVFLEISSVSAAALVAVNGNKTAMEASVKYIILSTLGSGSVLLAIANIYMVTGYLNLNYIAEALHLAYVDYPLNILASLGLLMVGLAVKAALYPLHVWLPDAHGSAPTASSAVLSGLVVKVYIIMFVKFIFRIFPIAFIETVPIQASLLSMSTLGILVGSVLAIRQTDIKKMLAYSTVAQIGYIFLGLGVLSPNAIIGSLLHILNHAVMKAMLFLSAGAIIKLTGIRELNRLDGVGRAHPVPMIAFSLGALAMIGIPPLNGFVSKWYLALGALDAEQPVFVFVILVSSFLNGLYYLPIIIRAFFGREPRFPENRVLPWGAQLSLIVLAAATVFFGLFSNVPVGYLTPAVQALFAN